VDPELGVLVVPLGLISGEGQQNASGMSNHLLRHTTGLKRRKDFPMLHPNYLPNCSSRTMQILKHQSSRRLRILARML